MVARLERSFNPDSIAISIQAENYLLYVDLREISFYSYGNQSPGCADPVRLRAMRESEPILALHRTGI
jgi:hypothetical protein